MFFQKIVVTFTEKFIKMDSYPPIIDERCSVDLLVPAWNNSMKPAVLTIPIQILCKIRRLQRKITIIISSGNAWGRL